LNSTRTNWDNQCVASTRHVAHANSNNMMIRIYKMTTQQCDCVCRVFTRIIDMHYTILVYNYNFCPTCPLLLGTKHNERKMTPIYVAIGVSRRVICFSLSLFESIFNPKMDIWKVWGPPMTTLSFQRWIYGIGAKKHTGTYLPEGQGAYTLWLANC
jgi:hypothetical protein